MQMKDAVWNHLERSINDPAFSPDDFERKTLADVTGVTEIPVFKPGQPQNPKIFTLKK